MARAIVPNDGIVADIVLHLYISWIIQLDLNDTHSEKAHQINSL